MGMVAIAGAYDNFAQTEIDVALGIFGSMLIVSS